MLALVCFCLVPNLCVFSNSKKGVSGREILAGAVPLPPAAQPLYEALARCHVYATGSTPRRPHNGLGPINEQQAIENYEYGEFISPGADIFPGEVVPNTPDHHSVAGMSDITSDPGY